MRTTYTINGYENMDTDVKIEEHTGLDLLDAIRMVFDLRLDNYPRHYKIFRDDGTRICETLGLNFWRINLPELTADERHAWDKWANPEMEEA